eukprot:TRINITY_DN27760_c0_g1_i1.p1 TRINITY_DN27760_c0_g1~~TRINITY_DN27760_c0_g1_i1.p1  ORF type:complete len:257 (+),score=55.37 TRINITY_DN27760_c0_g1_i1:125-895(+)
MPAAADSAAAALAVVAAVAARAADARRKPGGRGPWRWTLFVSGALVTLQFDALVAVLEVQGREPGFDRAVQLMQRSSEQLADEVHAALPPETAPPPDFIAATATLFIFSSAACLFSALTRTGALVRVVFLFSIALCRPWGRRAAGASGTPKPQAKRVDPPAQEAVGEWLLSSLAQQQREVERLETALDEFRGLYSAVRSIADEALSKLCSDKFGPALRPAASSVSPREEPVAALCLLHSAQYQYDPGGLAPNRSAS